MKANRNLNPRFELKFYIAYFNGALTVPLSSCICILPRSS